MVSHGDPTTPPRPSSTPRFFSLSALLKRANRALAGN